MFVPVFRYDYVIQLLANAWMFVIRSQDMLSLTHTTLVCIISQTMFTNDIYFWQAFRNTLILSLIKLFLNTGAAVIISLLLNEITNMIFKKTVQTIIYLPHFMSWVVVASVFQDVTGSI